MLPIALHYCFQELGRFTGLSVACVLGGDAIEKQFASIHSNPDVVMTDETFKYFYPH